MWESYGSTTTSTTDSTSTFTEFETDDIGVLKSEIEKLISEIGSAEIRVISDITFDIEVGITNNQESGEQP